MNIIISGAKHFGKTTVAQKLVEKLKQDNILVGGILCIGDDITDVITGEKHRFLYKQEMPDSQRIGSNYIKNKVIRFAEQTIENSVKTDKYTVIDEYGKLELKEKGFHNITKQSLESNKCIILIRNINVKPFLERFKQHQFKVYEITQQNRDNLHKEIFDYISESVR